MFTRANDYTILVQGASHFLGFPVVVDEEIPAGEMHMYLPNDPDNQTGEIELHAPSFMAEAGIEVVVRLRGETLATVLFTDDPTADATMRSNVAAELRRHLESIERVM
jgi:hypothetical protein